MGQRLCSQESSEDTRNKELSQQLHSMKRQEKQDCVSIFISSINMHATMDIFRTGLCDHCIDAPTWDIQSIRKGFVHYLGVLVHKTQIRSLQQHLEFLQPPVSQSVQCRFAEMLWSHPQVQSILLQKECSRKVQAMRHFASKLTFLFHSTSQPTEEDVKHVQCLQRSSLLRFTHMPYNKPLYIYMPDDSWQGSRKAHVLFDTVLEPRVVVYVVYLDQYELDSNKKSLMHQAWNQFHTLTHSEQFGRSAFCLLFRGWEEFCEKLHTHSFEEIFPEFPPCPTVELPTRAYDFLVQWFLRALKANQWFLTRLWDSYGMCFFVSCLPNSTDASFLSESSTAILSECFQYTYIAECHKAMSDFGMI